MCWELVKLIVTVPELVCGVSDSVTSDDPLCRPDNDGVRYRLHCPVCRNHKYQCNSTLYMPLDRVCLPADLKVCYCQNAKNAVAKLAGSRVARRKSEDPNGEKRSWPDH